ncbi:MAG: gliding motility lipoprotein GldD [Chlorobi bacterium]|nr:gliding motility lipoprotein GldD [Chlorobiota bacterium]
MKHKCINILVLILSVLLWSNCKRHSTPKPHGYFRITFPEKTYQTYHGPCPFTFEYPTYSDIRKDTSMRSEPCWYNIIFPRFNAEIHITYKPVHNNLPRILEDTYELAYKHTVKADAIKETSFVNDSLKVYGILYDIIGNTASNVQFYLTDSTHHYIRGALYFNLEPDKDSLNPVIRFLRKDIIHLVETFSWQ